MQPIGGVLEACVYVDDLAAAERFYTALFGFEVFGREEGRHVFFRAGGPNVFLVFDPRRTRDPDAQIEVGTGRIPLHGSSGAGHVAFSVAESALDAWRAQLETHGVAIETDMRWPQGGRSLYFRDPAGNSIELATPRIWGIPEPDARSAS